MMSKTRLVHDWKLAAVTYLCQNLPDMPEIARDFESKWFDIYLWWETHDIELQNEKKRPRNFYGANIAGMGVSQTQSILINKGGKYLRLQSKYSSDTSNKSGLISLHWQLSQPRGDTRKKLRLWRLSDNPQNI